MYFITNSYKRFSKTNSTVPLSFACIDVSGYSLFTGELFEIFLPLYGKSSVEFTNKAEGKKRRIMYDPAFAHTSLGNYYGTFNEVVFFMNFKAWTLLVIAQNNC